MSETCGPALLAIDVGSSRVKFGWFPESLACTSELKPNSLPIAAPKIRQPEQTLAISHRETSPENFSHQLNEWLEQFQPSDLNIVQASVRADAAKLVETVLDQNNYASVQQLNGTQLPIQSLVEQPEKVGIDRLLNAVAVNRLREEGRPAIVVDLGTANTVDLITADGDFAGGAIFPGVAMSARVLHESTSALPQLTTDELDSTITAVGKSTYAAISSGLYWGAVGAVSELIDRMSQSFSHPPQLFITGGDAQLLAPNLANQDGPARHIPHLVLAGIQLASEELL